MLPTSRPALRYFGGKWRIAPWIISHFPDHVSYVEPYSGGASVLLRKAPAKLETINDIDGDVVSFFKVLREWPDKLIRAIELTPYSRLEYKNAQEKTYDPIERARRYYIRSWFGRGGMRKQTAGWRYMVTDSIGGSVVDDWRRIGHLRQIVERLQTVQIENDDALKVIKRFDTPNTLFYVDPPYVFSSRSDRWHKAYTFEMDDEEHEWLSKALHQVQGMVIISGYDSELYDYLYSDWKFDTKKDLKESLKVSTEKIWMNANVYNRISQKSLFDS
jgi:DNA adenine methylase